MMNIYARIRQLIQHLPGLVARRVILDVELPDGTPETGNDGINAAPSQLWRIVDGNDHIY
jgi:hypothetical protein